MKFYGFLKSRRTLMQHIPFNLLKIWTVFYTLHNYIYTSFFLKKSKVQPGAMYIQKLFMLWTKSQNVFALFRYNYVITGAGRNSWNRTVRWVFDCMVVTGIRFFFYTPSKPLSHAGVISDQVIHINWKIIPRDYQTI